MSRAMIKNTATGEWEDRSMEYLHDLTVAHYTKLGLYILAPAKKQKSYALVECGELTEAVLKCDSEEVKKEAGDVLVCTINWCQIEGVDFMHSVKRAGERMGHEQQHHDTDPDELCALIHQNISFLASDVTCVLAGAIINLILLANMYEFTLADCLGNAYEKVMARKVKPLNGTLVKESDWHKYPELEKVAVL